MSSVVSTDRDPVPTPPPPPSRVGHLAPWSFFGSIRFRLTLWYTLLLAAVLVAIGVPFAAIYERQLTDDRDRRLVSAARQLVADYNPSLPGLGLYSPPDFYVQVVDAANTPQASSRNLGNADLSSGRWPPSSSDPQFGIARIAAARIRTVRLPIVAGGVLYGAVIVGEDAAPLNQTVEDLRRLLVLVGAAGLSLAALGGWLLAARALRPVDRVTAAAAAIADSDATQASLATRLDVPATADEIARLAATFNAMLDRLEAAFLAQRRFIADASHELRTPLTAIRGNVDVLLRQAGAGTGDAPVVESDVVDALDDMRRESARMGRLLEDLLLLARADAMPATPPVTAQPIALAAVARKAIRVASALVTGQSLTLDAATPITIVGDPDRLLQALLILLDNALRHTPAGGQIRLSVETAGDAALLYVVDTGAGISPEHLPHIFERFYRVDTARARATGGTGLGLAIAKAIIEAHGGTIAISSQPGTGTTVEIRLPVALADHPDAELPTRTVAAGHA